MRIAVAGKGGAGKTTISATIARLTARAGRRVIAIDADANPNLAVALGFDPQIAACLRPIPPVLVSRRLGGPGLTTSMDQVLADFALPGPDGLHLLGMGAPEHANEGCLCSAHAVVSAVLEDLAREPESVVVVDMEASPEHLSRGTIRHADVVCLVAEPYYRSLETVRRMAALATELPVARVVVIANKLRSPDDAEAVAEFCDRHGLPLVGRVPWGDGVAAADRARAAVVDCPGTEEVVEAIAETCTTIGATTPGDQRACRPQSAVKSCRLSGDGAR